MLIFLTTAGFLGWKKVCLQCCGENESTTSVMEPDKSYSGMCQKNSFSAASFVPECVQNIIREENLEILEDSRVPSSFSFPAIVLTCEVSSMAEIIDYYSVSIIYSVQDVADELNQHVTNLIKSVKVGEGDVIVFEDGLLQCMWIADPENWEETAKKALSVALYMQQQYDNTETKFGRNFRNSIGLSAGKLDMFFIGSYGKFYIPVGDVVRESRHASSICGKRVVVVSPSFWQKLNSTDQYKFQTLDDDFVTIYSAKKHQVQRSYSDIYDEEIQKQFQEIETEIGHHLWKFLPAPHNQAVTQQQVHILSSVTQIISITVRFLNLDISDPHPLQEAIIVLEEMVRKHEGALRNIMYTDTIIVSICFGYPGMKHSNDHVRSILCSQDIVKSLKKLNLKVTVAVFSGIAFCGVLGPGLRQECVVLGIPIHMTMKMVLFYSEIEIVCGINLFFLTRRVLGDIFKTLKKKMKTVKSMTTMVFFEVQIEPEKTGPITICANRKEEKKEISAALTLLRKDINEIGDVYPFITITGKLGMGKTVLLNWALEKAEEIGYSILFKIRNNVFEEPYDNSWSIVKDILRNNHIDSEDKVVELLDNEIDRYPLHFLNKLINTSFEVSTKQFEDEDIRNLMLILIRKCAKGDLILIGIDKAEHTGRESWLFLQDLMQSRAAVIMVTIAEELRNTIPFSKEQYSEINLKPMTAKDLGTLACHILNVQAVHKDFLDFFEKHSRGNSLILREILMMDLIRNHLNIVPKASIPTNDLEENFIYTDIEDENTIPKVVCDISDSDALWNIEMPSNLIDIFKDHTIGLSPEEQMLIRKCALLGESFGSYALEAVCPEYPLEELRVKTQSFISKHILEFDCDHLAVSHTGSRSTIYLLTMPLEFCSHPLKFSNEYLRQCIINAMPESQRERLNLYLADLLKISSKICDSCKRESDSYSNLMKNYRLPLIDMRICQCINLRIHVFLQVEYQLHKGNSLTKERIEILLEAADVAIQARNFDIVENIVNKTKRLINASEKDKERSTEEDNNKEGKHLSENVAVNRLRAEIKLIIGKNDDALRHLKQAMKLMDIIFPGDMKKKIYKNKLYEGALAKEEIRCLEIGSFIMKTLGDFDTAYKIAKLQLKILLKEKYTFVEIIKSKKLVLVTSSKMKPSKSRGKTIKKMYTQIQNQCFNRLKEYPIVDILELRVILSALKGVVQVLFEKGDLSAAKELGRKTFQLLKIVKNQKELSRILSFLAYIYFYQKNEEKCVEMINQLYDAVIQSGDTVAELLFYNVLIKALRSKNYNTVLAEKIQMCKEYAVRYSSIPNHPRYNDKGFCLCAKMSLWASEHNLTEASNIWSEKAIKLHSNIQLNNYWSLSGSLYLMITDINKIQEKFIIYNSEEIAKIRRNIYKDLGKLESAVKIFAPVLEEDVRETEKYFQNVLVESKLLKI